MAGVVSGDPLRWAEGTLRRYWSEDGLADVVVGLFLLAYGGLFGLGQHPHAAWARLLAVGLAVGMALGARPLVHRLKMRWVYPRVGYARPRTWPRGQRLRRAAWMVAGGAILLVLLLVLDLPARGACLLMGALMAALWGWLGWRHRAPRYGLLAAFSLLWVGWLSARPGLTCDVAVVLMALGFMSTVLGAVAFWRFLRRYPLPTTPGGA